MAFGHGAMVMSFLEIYNGNTSLVMYPDYNKIIFEYHVNIISMLIIYTNQSSIWYHHGTIVPLQYFCVSAIVIVTINISIGAHCGLETICLFTKNWL